MGVFIELHLLPDLIDESEWTTVYHETLQLINAYPFMDKIVDRSTYDRCWIYVAKTQERKIPVSSITSCLGWHTIGDEVSMQSAESFMLFKDLNYYRQQLSEPNRPGMDILFNILEYYTSCDISEKYILPNTTSVFDSKTQGYPYHIYMLAIACLIEARFPHCAMVYGDITVSQMKKAISWANTILSKPVSLTDRTDNEILLARISAGLPDPYDRMEAFMAIVMQPKDRHLGDFIRNSFPPEVIDKYFCALLKEFELPAIGFYNNLHKYLNLGFSLGSACDLCVLSPDGCQYDPADFVDVALGMGWKKPDDEMPDVRHLIPTAVNDPDNENPETIDTLFGKIMTRMAGFRDSVKTDLSYTEAVSVLQEKLGHLCPVPAATAKNTGVSGQDNPGTEKNNVLPAL